MRLLEVRLENFKSFDREGATIPFEPGVNVLSGHNGAGKSSVLQAVGLSIFQHNTARNLGALARLGGGSWRATVRFEGTDRLVYRIERSERRYVLFEEGRDEELASGVGPVEAHLRNITGVDPDMPPAQFFSRVLCANQGEYTRDLEVPEKKRKETFDPLFKVDRFKSLDKALTPVSSKNRLVQKAVRPLEDDARSLRERAAPLKETRERREQLQRDHRERVREREQVAEQLKKLRAELEAAEARKARVAELVRDLELRAQAVAHAEGARDEARARLDAAEAAAARCDQHREGAARHRRALEKLEELRPRLEEAEARRDEFRQLDAAAQEAEAQARRCQEALEQGQARLDERRAELERIQAQLRAAVQQADSRQRAYDDLAAALEELRPLPNEAKQAIRRTEDAVDALRHDADELAQRKDRLEALRAEAQRGAERREEQGRLGQLKDGLRRLRDEHASAEAQIRLIEREKVMLTGGQCPFVNVQCPGIEGQPIADQVDRKLTDLNARRVELDREIDEYENWLKKAEAAERELEAAERAADEARQVSDEVDRKQRRLRDRLDKASPHHAADALLRLATGLDELAGVPDVDLRRRIEELGASPVKAAERLAGPLDAARQILARLEAAYEDARTQRDESRRTHQDAVRERDRLDGDLERVKEDLDALEKQVQRDRLKLDDLRDRARRKAAERDAQAEAPARFDALRADAEALRQAAAADRADHEAMLTHQAAADQREARHEELTKATAEVSNRQQEHEDLQRRLDAAQREVGDAGSLDQLQANRDRLVQREASLATSIRRDVEQLDELDARLEDMRAARAKARELQREIDEYHEAGKLLTGIRKVFQDAAPRLARRYLQAVSREATRGYRSLAPRDPAEIVWDDSYQVSLKGRFFGGDEVQEKDFSMLSGGEQMAVAVALKLALARVFSRSKVMFLDEPTIHLDRSRRENLAQHLTRAAQDLGFEQLVVISHDATFDATHQHAIRLEKVDGRTQVSVGS